MAAEYTGKRYERQEPDRAWSRKLPSSIRVACWPSRTFENIRCVGSCPESTISYIGGWPALGRCTMATLRSLGKDPVSDGGQSPTVWEAGDCYVVQGWNLPVELLTQVGQIPAGEGVVLIPKRLMSVFPEVHGGAVAPSAD
jgi:hypothetical protein